MKTYRVLFDWDEESEVWVATSEEVPGLALESGSFDALVERLRFVVPELLELNGVRSNPINLQIASTRELVAA